METPLTCDECGTAIDLGDGELTEVVADGTSLSESEGFFIAVEDAVVEDHSLRIVEADVYCADHAPETAYEYGQ